MPRPPDVHDLRPSGEAGGDRAPSSTSLTFAYDEATLIRWHAVRYLLDTTRGSHVPVASATASSPGYCQAPEAISLLRKTQAPVTRAAAATSTTSRLPWGAGSARGRDQPARQKPDPSGQDQHCAGALEGDGCDGHAKQLQYSAQTGRQMPTTHLSPAASKL